MTYLRVSGTAFALSLAAIVAPQLVVRPASSITAVPVTLGGTLNLVTTSTDGLVVENTTASTVGVPVQISPRGRFSGTGWDTDDTVSRTVSYFTEVLPTSAATVAGLWKLGYIDPVSAAITYPITVGATGNLTVLGTSDSTGGNTASAYTTSSVNGFFRVITRTAILMPADGQMNVTNNAFTVGVGMDVATDAVLKIRTRAQTGYATIDALAYQVSGVAGVDCTSAAAVTTAKGIVTACTAPETLITAVVIPGLLLEGIDLRAVQTDVNVIKAELSAVKAQLALITSELIALRGYR